MESAAAPSANHTDEPPAKKQKGGKGYPPGILQHNTNSGDMQARLVGVKVDGKAYQRPIPGRYKSIEAAVAAQAVAMRKFEIGGVVAVWPTVTPSADRNARGEVRCRHSKQATVNASPPHELCTDDAMNVAHRDQSASRRQSRRARLLLPKKPLAQLLRTSATRSCRRACRCPST
jgi:hypothetical protein